MTILFFLIAAVCHGQSQRFSEFYDHDTGSEVILNVIQNEDGFLAQGVNFNSGVMQSYTVKIDEDGNILDDYAVYDVNVGYESTSLIQLSSGQVVSAGHICDYNQSSPSPCDFYFARLDETGDTLFTKIYERKDTCDLLLDMVQTRPNKIMLIGWTCNDTTQNNTELLFITVDTLGNEVNRVVWGGGGTDYIHSGLVINEMGEVLMTGGTQSFGGSDYDTWLVKTDSIGNVLWQKTYNGISSGGGGGTRVLALPDGNFAIVGGVENTGTGKSDALLMKVDPDGNEIWVKKFVAPNGSHSFWSGAVLDDGTIVAAGQTTNTADNSQAGWLVKTDANGDTLWTHTYNPSSLIDRLLNMLVMPNGDIVMVGSGRAPGQTNQDGWILRVDSMGCEVEGCFTTGIDDRQLAIDDVRLKVYPNPASEAIRLSINGLLGQDVELSAVDMLGRQFPLEKGVPRNEVGDYFIEYNVSHWTNGIYLLTLTDDDGNRYTQRLVVRH